ncbi:Decaprenyl-Diphosphate Synthase Subunit 1 [Manis pentadactyla]|nr:Decaprenyl-Diphosphate Synthase Subunit 1 [Manis pentadactyla]
MSRNWLRVYICAWKRFKHCSRDICTHEGGKEEDPPTDGERESLSSESYCHGYQSGTVSVWSLLGKG